ncbi:MAG: CRISPR system precrRNA processing endoribonuclease RAMP protein Cas6 [Pseudomonadota bacterium]
MSDFTLARFQFSIKLLRGGNLPPYKGSCLRGALGHSLRALACKDVRPTCDGCGSADACLYIRLFKPDQGSGKSIPAPYIIDPPPLKETRFAKGDEFSFILTLVGWAAEYINLWIEAARICGEKQGLGTERIPFELIRAAALPESGDLVVVYDGCTVIHDAPLPRIYFSQILQRSAAAPAHAEAAVHLLTPLKFKDQGEVSGSLTAGLFLQTLFRRCKSLAHFYQSEDPFNDGFSPDFSKASMHEQNLRWIVLEKKSMNHSSAINLGGFVGTFRLANLNPDTAALLRLGEYIHLGKNTVYGCGKYRIEFIS